MKFKKNTSVFVRWLISYIIMLGMMILASMIIYVYSYNVINEQQERVNAVMLEKIQAEVDNRFEAAKTAVISLYMDSEVEQLMNKKGNLDVTDRPLVYNAYESIRNKIISSEEFDGVFVYFLNGDSVLSGEGHMNQELFYEVYYNNQTLSKTQFDALMRQKWNGNVVNIKNSNNEEELVFLRNSFRIGYHELNATIGVSIFSDKIIELMNRLKWKENTEVIVLNDEHILCSNGNLGEVLLEKYTMNEVFSMDSKEIILEGEKYHIICISSPTNEFHYVALTLQKEIHEEAKKIQSFMIVLMTVCLTIGVLVAYLLTRINYNPLKQVIDSFGDFNRKVSDRNEYEWLLEQKRRFHDEHQAAKRKIDEKEKSLRQQYLYRLVSLPYDNRYKKYIDFSKDKLFEKSNVLVALFYVEAIDTESVYANMEKGLERFVYTNILEELLQNRANIEFVELMDCFACIINTDKEIGEVRELLEEVLDMMQRFLMECMQLRLSVVVGSCQKGMDGLHLSYLFAREAAEYRNFMQDMPQIWYEDIKNRHMLYQYNSEAEQKIINAISVGNVEDALMWIDEVIDFNYSNREMTLVMKKCLIFEMMGTIIKGAEQGSRTEFVLNYMDENIMPEYWSKERAEEYLHGIVNGLCEDIKNNEMLIREDKQFGWQVMEYVQKNYHNPDLNISITALHFGITPSYLSSLFKEQTGLNLLEYINHTRVEEAKKLLEEGCSLIEVCDKTGFRSSGALIRVFKKITGITPGQMKKMLGHSSKE